MCTSLIWIHSNKSQRRKAKQWSKWFRGQKRLPNSIQFYLYSTNSNQQLPQRTYRQGRYCKDPQILVRNPNNYTTPYTQEHSLSGKEKFPFKKKKPLTGGFFFLKGEHRTKVDLTDVLAPLTLTTVDPWHHPLPAQPQQPSPQELPVPGTSKIHHKAIQIISLKILTCCCADFTLHSSVIWWILWLCSNFWHISFLLLSFIVVFMPHQHVAFS